MKKLIQIAAVFGLLQTLAWADGMPGLPMGGVMIYKDTNIVTIAGKTLVIGEQTRFVSCAGNTVTRLASGVSVSYTIQQPSEGPTPVLATVTEVCG